MAEEGTLKDSLAESERLFKETGYLFGFSTLELKEADPIKYETVWGMLQNASYAAYETARKISTSPIVREVGDCMWGFLLPTGEPCCTSYGIYAHFTCMGTFVKWMIEHDYEEDPGFHHGDIFECNEPHYAGVHVPDVYDVIPIIYKGELVGWAAGVNHLLEVGGITPGSIVNLAPECFDEGLHICAEKIGSDDKLDKSYISRVNVGCRMPSFWLMDCRSRIAGCLIIREKVLEIVERYGVDYFKKATREYVEDSRRYTLGRILSQAIPGRLRKTSCKDVMMKGKGVLPQQNRDYMVHQPTEIVVKPDGHVKVSLDGGSGWLWFGINCTPDSIKGAFNVAYTGMIGFDLVNYGSLATVELDVPPGTWANPHPVYPFASTAIPWTLMVTWIGSFFALWSRLYFSRGYLEEVLSGGPHSVTNETAGLNAYGIYVAGLNVEMTCNGMPARAIGDGENVSWSIYNPYSDQGTAEAYEDLFHYIYLSRRIAPDSAGFGKYRGGLGWNPVWLGMNSPGFSYAVGDLGVRSMICTNDTMFGSYPAQVDRGACTMGSNMKQLIEQKKPLIHERGDPRSPNLLKLEGKVYTNLAIPWYSPGELHEYDVMEYIVPGGQGFGDPIERPLDRIKYDLDRGFTLVETVNHVYGAEAKYDEKAKEWIVDEKATQKLRQRIREERRKRGIPFKEWWQKERERVKAKQMPEAVADMYRTSMNLSPRYAKEIREFWKLPDDFTF
jgi:N-methylhydantoinase B/oxoprolinase/acetone carboxylase alpha subunit